MPAGGDSGSLLMDSDLNAVGLLFAGSALIAIHNHIADVRDRPRDEAGDRHPIRLMPRLGRSATPQWQVRPDPALLVGELAGVEL